MPQARRDPDGVSSLLQKQKPPSPTPVNIVPCGYGQRMHKYHQKFREGFSLGKYCELYKPNRLRYNLIDSSEQCLPLVRLLYQEKEIKGFSPAHIWHITDRLKFQTLCVGTLSSPRDISSPPEPNKREPSHLEAAMQHPASLKGKAYSQIGPGQ